MKRNYKALGAILLFAVSGGLQARNEPDKRTQIKKTYDTSGEENSKPLSKRDAVQVARQARTTMERIYEKMPRKTAKVMKSLVREFGASEKNIENIKQADTESFASNLAEEVIAHLRNNLGNVATGHIEDALSLLWMSHFAIGEEFLPKNIDTFMNILTEKMERTAEKARELL